MRNLELKFRCAKLDAVAHRARSLGAEDAGVLMQHDLFFPAAGGRRKLRDFGNNRGELIAYRRPDQVEARRSDYLLAPTEDVAMLGETLVFALGNAGEVRKRRHLFLWRNTRIHLDQVEGLGSFVELETVIRDQSEAEAQEESTQLVRTLGLKSEDRVGPAYINLMRVPGTA